MTNLISKHSSGENAKTSKIVKVYVGRGFRINAKEIKFYGNRQL